MRYLSRSLTRSRKSKAFFAYYTLVYRRTGQGQPNVRAVEAKLSPRFYPSPQSGGHLHMRLGQWEKALRETEDSLRLEPSVVVEHSNLVPYRFVAGQLQRSRKLFATRGLNEDHNHELKNIFKSAATTASARPGPFHDFYAALLAKGMRPSMARLTLARKIAAITLTLWKKGERFDAEHLKRQAA